jgi:acetylornithine deacetylase
MRKQDQWLKNSIARAAQSLEDELVTFIRKLVQTPSLPGEEKNVQEWIAQKLQSLHFQVDIVPIDPNALKHHPAFSHDGFPVEKRVNVVGRWLDNDKNPSFSSTHEARAARSLILNGHVDVVSPGAESQWHGSPWSGYIENGRIYGRGSADMKAGLAAAIFACQVLQRLGYQPHKEVMIQSVVGEETGGCGTLTNIVNGYTADAAIITEPTQLKIYPVQSGALSFRIRIKGKSMHACMKNRGVSAVEKFYIIFRAIEAFDRERHANYSHPLFEDPTNVAPINIGVVHGGDWPSTVPDNLLAEGRYGVFPGQSVADAKRAFEDCIQQAAESDEWLSRHHPVVEWFEGQFEAGATSIDEPVVKTLSAGHRVMLDEEARFSAATYGSDLRLFTNHARIPAVLYGPGDVKEAHTVNESIAIHEVLDAVKVLAFTIYNWCGGGVAGVETGEPSHG